MEQTRTLQGELTVTLFADQIRWLDNNNLAIWKTPGSSTVYMHDHAEFATDRCVANVRDVLDAAGVQDIDELGDNDYAELHIWI